MARTAPDLFADDADEILPGALHATGLLPAQHLRSLIEQSHEIQSLFPIAPEQIQPASLDLRLGATAWRVRASFLPGEARDRPGQDRRLRDASLRARRCRHGAREGLRLHRRALGVPGAQEAHLGDRQPQELDRPPRRVRPPDHRSRPRVRSGVRQLSGAALRRDRAPDLQHPGAARRPPEPDPDQARHAALERRRHAPAERARPAAPGPGERRDQEGRADHGRPRRPGARTT